MGRIGRHIKILRQQGVRALLRLLLTRSLDRLNADNNGNPAANGEFALLRACLRPSMVVVDVGANLGAWTAQALSIQPTLKIYAFEPVSHLFQALHQRFAEDKRVICLHTALADQPGESEIFIDGFYSGSNSLFCRPVFSEVIHEKIPLTTGDAFVAENSLEAIDFLKLDVEGAEMKVLQGFRQTFAHRKISVCQVEYGGTYIDAGVYLRDVFAFAHQVGYGVAKLLPRGLRLLDRYDQVLESFKYSNYLLYRDIDVLPQKFQYKQSVKLGQT
jgi:FkbM family methyltransferase